MSRRQPLTPARLAGRTATVCLSLLLAGCSSAEVDPPPDPPVTPTVVPPVILPTVPALDQADQSACAALIAVLPDTLAGRPRVVSAAEPSGDTTGRTSYGDPAIVVICGVGAPDGFDPTAVPRDDDPSPCTQVSGVGWWVPLDQLDGDGDALLTAVTFTPRIAVLVPQAYLPEGSAAALAELAAPIKRTLRRSLRCG